MFGRIDGFSSSMNSTSVPRGAGLTAAEGAKGSFGTLLHNALSEVNNLQLEAEEAARALALGTVDDVHSVMIATAKADLALQLTIQVRNKVIEAYQEISRMQV